MNGVLCSDLPSGSSPITDVSRSSVNSVPPDVISKVPDSAPDHEVQPEFNEGNTDHIEDNEEEITRSQNQ